MGALKKKGQVPIFFQKNGAHLPHWPIHQWQLKWKDHQVNPSMSGFVPPFQE